MAANFAVRRAEGQRVTRPTPSGWDFPLRVLWDYQHLTQIQRESFNGAPGSGSQLRQGHSDLFARVGVGGVGKDPSVVRLPIPGCRADASSADALHAGATGPDAPPDAGPHQAASAGHPF